jgi:hypothetical protein
VVPEAYRATLKEGPLPIHKCIRYTDHALRRFFDSARRQPWFANTIFVITSDHTNMSDHAEYQSDIGGFAAPIIIYDPEHHAAAVAHAGWRGTVARIAEKTVAKMQTVYHSRPHMMRAVIGPCITVKNFEVGDEVYEAFADAGFPMSQIALRQEKWHIDLPLCNQLQLSSAGIPAEQIVQSGICTFDHCDQYFSARRLGIRSGRIYSGIVLH